MSNNNKLPLKVIAALGGLAILIAGAYKIQISNAYYTHVQNNGNIREGVALHSDYKDAQLIERLVFNLALVVLLIAGHCLGGQARNPQPGVQPPPRPSQQ